MDIKLVIQDIKDLAEPLLEANGMELVDIEFRTEASGWILRLFIDKPEGINIDDCVFISRQLGDILDVEDNIPVSYSLEVSSPGLNRPLVKLADFERFKGRTGKIRMSSDIDGRKNFKGILHGINGEKVIIKVDNEIMELPFSHIEKARLVAEV